MLDISGRGNPGAPKIQLRRDRIRRKRLFDLGPGPVEPGRQGFEIGFFRPWRRTRCAGPEGRRDSRRCPERRLPFPERPRFSWSASALASSSNPWNQGSVIEMQTEVLERILASFARNPAQPLFLVQASSTARLALDRSIRPFNPPTLSAQVSAVEIIFHRHHGRGVDGLAFEDAFDKLAALGHAEDLGHRPMRRIAFQPRHRIGRQHQNAMRGFAAQHLLPGESGGIELVPGQIHRKRRRGGVADGDAIAVGGNPITIGNLHARGGAVPQKDGVAILGGFQVRDFAIAGLVHRGP